MTNDKKAREFWLTTGNCAYTSQELSDYKSYCVTGREVIHVIEYSAVESLLEIIEDLREALEYYKLPEGKGFWVADKALKNLNAQLGESDGKI